MNKNSEMLIGIHGKAGAGKDTAALALQEKIGLFRVAFADPIKRALVCLFRDTYGLTMDHFTGPKKEQVIAGLGKSPRELMQSFGTKWGRDCVNTDVWVMIAANTINRQREYAGYAYAPFAGTVVSDVRFDNEAQWIRDQGGMVIHLHRAAARPVNKCVSESGIAIKPMDVLIANNGSIESLQKRLFSTVIDLFNPAKGVAKVAEQ